MKLLETTAKPARMSIISNALSAIIASISLLLTWIKMFFIVGFVITAAVILGALLDVLVRICNYRNGTEYRTGPILKGLLTSLWKEALKEAKKEWNSQRNS